MVNLNKLKELLDTALASETSESLNMWIDNQMQADKQYETNIKLGEGLSNIQNLHFPRPMPRP